MRLLVSCAALLGPAAAHARRGDLPPPPDSVALTVEDVTPAGDGAHVVFLTDATHARIVPVQVGESEAVAIAFRLAGRSTERPLTHDLLEQAVLGLGARIERVYVHGLDDGMFRATVTLRRKRTTLALDARASDAIALALDGDLPVWMDRALYERAGVTMEALLEGLDRMDRGRPARTELDEAL